jgi:hypothetical protein
MSWSLKPGNKGQENTLFSKVVGGSDKGKESQVHVSDKGEEKKRKTVPIVTGASTPAAIPTPTFPGWPMPQEDHISWDQDATNAAVSALLDLQVPCITCTLQ